MAEKSQKNQLICSTQDQGIGLSRESLSHILDAFSQAETSTTRQYGGTGLGLAISSKLVEMLGGKLELESELGKGSRFYFSIPAKQVCLKAEDPATEPSNSKLSGHLLLVEDNKTNQMLMSAILKKQGLSFDIANDDLEAIELVKKTKYDLVLMDESMPNLNGIEATKRIREWELQTKKTTLTIIALTANAMTGDKERFLEAGMNEYLAKPINLPKLLATLKLYLN